VIGMYTGGVDQETIMGAIRTRQVEFDPFDTDTALAIAKAKLPVNIQNELRKKVGAPLLQETAAPKAAPPKPAAPPKSAAAPPKQP
jgi:hypothetical protein